MLFVKRRKLNVSYIRCSPIGENSVNKLQCYIISNIRNNTIMCSIYYSHATLWGPPHPLTLDILWPTPHPHSTLWTTQPLHTRHFMYNTIPSHTTLFGPPHPLTLDTNLPHTTLYGPPILLTHGTLWSTIPSHNRHFTDTYYYI